MFEGLKDLGAIQILVVFLLIVFGIVTTVLNMFCIANTVRQKSFCIISTNINILVLSLCGGNCLIGLTTIAKELTFVFLEHEVPRYWSNFESYITIFCLVISTLHLLAIVSIYLIGTSRIFPRKVKLYERFLEVLTIAVIWTLSFAPSVIQNGRKHYDTLLFAVSLSLLLTLFALMPLTYCVIKFQQKVTNLSITERYCSRGNFVKKKWLRYRQKEKSICLWLVLSYIICSVPYMIYFPVLGRMYNGKRYSEDLIDDILYFFILVKTISDAVIYIVKKGWKRDNRKVNFRLKNNEKKMNGKMTQV